MDNLGRLISLELGKRWNVPVVVENRAGAGGIIAADLVARSAADGYTLLLSGDSLVSSVTLFAGKANYDPVKSFAPVTIAATTATVVAVRAESPVDSFQALAKLAGERRITVGTPGHATGNHFALASLQHGIKGDFQHVPYKGAGPAVSALLTGQVDAAIVALPAVTQLVRAGRVRALAVFQNRSAILPEVPTVTETGFNVETKTGWFGVLAPAGTPAPIVAKLQTTIATIIRDEKFREALLEAGYEPVGGTSEELAARIREDSVKLPALLASIGANTLD